MVALADVRIVTIAESSADPDAILDRLVVDALLGEAVAADAELRPQVAAMCGDADLVARICRDLTWTQVAATLRGQTARRMLETSRLAHGRTPRVLGSLAAATADAGTTLFLGRLDGGAPRAWFAFGVDDRDAEAIADASRRERADVAAVMEATATAPMAYGGVLAVANAVDAGCWRWLRSVLHPDIEEEPRMAAVRRTLVAQVARLAVAAIARDAKDADANARILADPGSIVAATAGDGAWMLRCAMASQAVHTVSSEMILPHLLTLPRCYAVGQTTASVDDYGSLAFGIGGRRRRGTTAELAMQVGSLTRGGDSGITAAMLADVCGYSAYALDIVFGTLSLVLEDITTRSQPGRMAASRAHEHPTTVTWDALVERIRWRSHGRSDRTLRTLRQDTLGILRRLDGVQLAIRGVKPANGPAPILFSGSLLSVDIDNSRDPESPFVVAEVRLGKVLHHALFERDLIDPAIVDAGHVFAAGGLADDAATSKTVLERRSYQSMAVAVDLRTREAIRSGRSDVVLTDQDVLREVGISPLPPVDHNSAANRYEYRVRYIRRVDALLTRMRDYGHVRDFQRAGESSWAVTPGDRMGRIVRAMVAAEAAAGRERGRLAGPPR